jgi:hypothetical protein
MKILLNSAALLLAFHNLPAFASAPFGEAVNCKTVTSQVAIYQGYASCTVRSTKPPYDLNTLSEYIFATQNNQRYLTAYANGQTYSCWATVPFSHYEPVTRQECQYKPVAEFNDGMPSHSSFGIFSAARDYDGSIVSYQWHVDGAAYSTAASFTLPYKSGLTSTYLIQLTVTDNHGHSSSVSRSITVPNDECRTQACRNR